MLFDLTIKSVWRRKARSLLTILGVAAAIQLYLLSNNIMATYEQDIQHQINAFAGRIYVQQSLQTAGGMDFPSMDSSIVESEADGMLTGDGIAAADSSPLLFVQLSSTTRPNMPPLFFAVGMTPGHESAFIGNVPLASGSGSLADAQSVILGFRAADHFRPAGADRAAVPGDRVTVHGEEFTVAGVLQDSSTLYNGAVILPLATAQRLFNREGSVSAVILTVDRMENLTAIKDRAQADHPGLTVFNQADLARNADQILSQQRMMFTMIKVSVILAVVMMVMIVVVVAVMEQRRDIGTLRAVGAGRLKILGFVAGEAVLLSLAGGLVALPVSSLVNAYLNFGLDFTPGELAGQWLFITGGCVLLGLFAAFLPAWQAVRVNPLEALQSE